MLAVLLLLQTLRLGDAAPPAMTVHPPPPDAVVRTGVVVAAPHDGYDLHTGIIGRKVARLLVCPAVVATGYRKKSAGRFLNVNRPTGCVVESDGALGPEEVTAEATDCHEAWLRVVESAKASAAIDAGEPVPLYVEIHGHGRKVKSPEPDGDDVVVEVIEVATLGFAFDELRELARRWDELRAANPELAPMAFDALHPTYEFDGLTVPFKYKALGAKRRGVLRPPYVRRALHFELPRSSRLEANRLATSKALATLVTGIRVD